MNLQPSVLDLQNTGEWIFWWGLTAFLCWACFELFEWFLNNRKADVLKAERDEKLLQALSRIGDEQSRRMFETVHRV